MSKPTFDALGYRMVDKVVTISDGVRGKFDPTDIDTTAEKFKTIYTGVDIEEFDPHSEYDTTFAFEDGNSINIVQVAKLHPRKHQDNLLKAVSRITDKIPEYNLILAGPTAEGYEEYAQSLHNLAEQEGIEENVFFLGWCDEVPALLSKTDLFVLPSAHEGFPRSILEAFAMGVPAIATPAGGTAELVEDGETGLIVPIDDIDALAEEIVYLCSNPEVQNKFAEAAQTKVLQNFQQQTYIEEFEQTINEII